MTREIRVICPDCGDTVVHSCHSALRRAIVDLLTWVPPDGPATEGLAKAIVKAGREWEWIDKDDKRSTQERFAQPIFGSQAWSYPLLGSKDTARTFHTLIANVCQAAGVDERQVMSDFYSRREAEEKAENERKAAVKKKRDARDEVAAYLKDSTVPLEQRIAWLDELLAQQVKRHKLVPFAERDDPDGEGFDYLYRFLKTYYGNGITDDINQARIKTLEFAMYEERKAQAK